MKKPIDLDGLFEEKLALYMKKNAGKYTLPQWEALIPKLYQKFGDTYIKSLCATPNGYYRDMSEEELAKLFVLHFQEQVPVSDFFRREIEKRDKRFLLPLILDKDEALAKTALSLAGDFPGAVFLCFQVLEGDFSEERKELARGLIKENAETAKSLALAFLKRKIEPDFMLEVLSSTEKGDDEVFFALLSAFKEAGENLQLYAGFLAEYGDERALPVLEEALGREEINYLEYREIRYAVEALGGECIRERDFSNDPYYLEVSKNSAPSSDLLKDQNQET